MDEEDEFRVDIEGCAMPGVRLMSCCGCLDVRRCGVVILRRETTTREATSQVPKSVSRRKF